jgi:hypothetical protein
MRAGALTLLATLTLATPPVAAQPVDTPVVVRVQAHDAKFIGSGVGEMNVVIEDADTGAPMASGRISGGTGDTARLVGNPVARGAKLADADSAGFTATLKIDRPTRIRVRATGPLGTADSVQELSVTTWVVPGRPIAGDGIVLRLPGLIVTPRPQPAEGTTLPLAADVVLMCGCPLTRGGLWDADDYEVKARVERTGEATAVQEAALAFTGETNRFAGKATLPGPGRYQVTVWAHNPKTGNTGATSWSVDVR